MGKKPTKSGNIHLPPGSDPPPDESVVVPRQIKHAAAVANALATGQPVPPKPKPEARRGFPHTDGEIDQALERLRTGALQVGDPEFDVVRNLAEQGAHHIKSRRRGAGKPREKSEDVTRRLTALVQAYGELSTKLQKHRTGVPTLLVLRQAVIKKLGLTDNDDVISEETIKNDMRELRPILRLI